MLLDVCSLSHWNKASEVTFGKVMHVVVVCGFFFFCEMQISSALKHIYLFLKKLNQAKSFILYIFLGI